MELQRFLLGKRDSAFCRFVVGGHIGPVCDDTGQNLIGADFPPQGPPSTIWAGNGPCSDLLHRNGVQNGVKTAKIDESATLTVAVSKSDRNIVAMQNDLLQRGRQAGDRAFSAVQAQ